MYLQKGKRTVAGKKVESVSAKENIGINSLLGKIGEAIKNKK